MSSPRQPGGDTALAGELATRAGQVLREVRERHLRAGGAPGADLEDLGDRTAQSLISRTLRERRPDDAVLSEEAPDDPARLHARRVWIIDPLDGTREYGQDRHDWAVHVALWQDGDLRTGAVALPDEESTYVAGEVTAPPPADRPLRFSVSRSRTSPLVRTVVDRLGGVEVPDGSAGYKTMAVALGRTDVYLHTGGQFQWDSAAPVAVARAAGLHTSRVDGSDLRYNERDTWLPDLLVCRPELAGTLLDAVAATLR